MAMELKHVYSLMDKSRAKMSLLLQHTDLEKLNKIPSGFNNNIFWNIGHIISVQQMLVYGLGGQTWALDKEFVKSFKNGSKPERIYTEEDKNLVSTTLLSSLKRQVDDEEMLVGSTYQAFETRTGFVIIDYPTACIFNLYHESYHAGIINELQKLI